MQTNGRPLGKAERQRLLAGIVARKRVGTQLELAAELAAAGSPVTQATISRDIRELGLEKTHDTLGRPRYVVPAESERRRPDPKAALGAVLSQFGRGAALAQNIVVLHSELGSAPAIARALDQVRSSQGRRHDRRRRHVSRHRAGREGCARPRRGARRGDRLTAQPTGGRRSIHGLACSSCAASRKSVASANGLPMTCTPIGRPSSLQCSGTDIAG